MDLISVVEPLCFRKANHRSQDLWLGFHDQKRADDHVPKGVVSVSPYWPSAGPGMLFTPVVRENLSKESSVKGLGGSEELKS